MRIGGEIAWPAALGDIAALRVRIRVEDVSRADAAARTVAELTLPAVTAEDAAKGAVPFSLEVVPPPGGADYALRVHVDVNGTGAVTPGDWVTVERIPVSSGTTSVGRIRLQRVG